MSYPVHVCSFTGKRSRQCPPPNTKCELSTRPRGCKIAVGYAVYAWGAAALCERHLVEETGQTEANCD